MQAIVDMEETMKVGVRRTDVLCRSKWIVSINPIVTRLR